MPRHASSHAQGPNRHLFQIMFLPGLPVCGHDCHIANLAILLCQYVLSVPMLYCYDAWRCLTLQGSGTQQCFQAVRVLWECQCLFQPPVIIHSHLPASKLPHEWRIAQWNDGILSDLHDWRFYSYGLFL